MAETVRLLPKTDDGRQIPAYGHPEAAAAAVACAARYRAWRATPRGGVPKLADIKGDDTRTLVREFLVTGGGWLPPEVTATLLRCHGIPLAELVPVRSEDEAAAAFADGGGIPVVLKADVPGLVHKTDAGGVELDLRTEADVRPHGHQGPVRREQHRVRTRPGLPDIGDPGHPVAHPGSRHADHVRLTGPRPSRRRSARP